MKDPATGKPPIAGPWVARVEKGSSDIYEFYYGTEEGESTAQALQTWVTDNKHATLNDLVRRERRAKRPRGESVGEE
jgi:hypothetical protein